MFGVHLPRIQEFLVACAVFHLKVFKSASKRIKTVFIADLDTFAKRIFDFLEHVNDGFKHTIQIVRPSFVLRSCWIDLQDMPLMQQISDYIESLRLKRPPVWTTWPNEFALRPTVADSAVRPFPQKIPLLICTVPVPPPVAT